MTIENSSYQLSTAGIMPGVSTYRAVQIRAATSLINGLPAANIKVLKDTDGSPLDGVEVVARYIESLPGRIVDPTPNRIRLVRPLPPALFGFPEIQPLRGARF